MGAVTIFSVYGIPTYMLDMYFRIIKLENIIRCR